MVKLKGDKEIGDKINNIIATFAKANNLTGVVDQAGCNDETKLGTGKEIQDCLSRLLASSIALTSAPTAANATSCWLIPTST